MMSRTTSMLFLAAVGLSAVPTFADGVNFNCNVSERHHLFRVEKTARNQKLQTPADYERFAVKSQDELKETYRKLLRLSKVRHHFSSEPGDAQVDMSSINKFIAQQCRKAHEFYSGSAAIASIALRYTYLATRNLEKLKVIVPFVQERDYVPGISRSIWTVFNHSRRNYDRKKEKRYRRLLGLQDKADKHPKEILNILRKVWASRIDPDYSTEWTEQKVVDIEDKLPPEKRRTAQLAWRNLVKACYDVSPAQMKYEIRQEFEEREKKRRKKEAKEHKETRTQVRKEARRSLERLEERPNDFNEIEEVMNEAFKARMVNQDWGIERLPNYETIKNKLGKHEAATLNLLYKTRVLREHENLGQQLKKLLKKKPQDTRLLMLKAMKAIHVRNFKEAMSIVNKIIDLDPDHTKARNIRERILRTTQIDEENH